MKPDLVQIRLYVGNKYLEIRLPTPTSKPEIRGELIEPHKTPVEAHALLGGYTADVVWVEGADGPSVVVKANSTASKGKG